MKIASLVFALTISSLAFADQVKVISEIETWYNVETTPLVVGDKVYVGTYKDNRSGALFILSQDGEVLKNIELDSVPSSPTLLSNNTLALGGYRCVYLLDLKGNLIKKVSTHAQNTAFGSDKILALPDGFVVSGGSGAGVPIGFFTNKGELIKSFASEDISGWSNPVLLHDGTIVIGGLPYRGTENVFYFNQSGEKLKSMTVGHRWIATPLALPDGSLILWAGVEKPGEKASSEFFFVNPDGKVRWSVTSKYLTESPPALTLDNRIVTSIDGMLYVFDQDGKHWTLFPGNEALGYNPPTVMTDGTIIMSSAPSLNRLYFITPEGKERATWDQGRYIKAPAVTTPNGNIVIGTSAGWDDGHGRIYFLKLQK